MSDRETWDKAWPLLSGENADILRTILRGVVASALGNGMSNSEIAAELTRLAEQLRQKVQ